MSRIFFQFQANKDILGPNITLGTARERNMSPFSVPQGIQGVFQISNSRSITKCLCRLFPNISIGNLSFPPKPVLLVRSGNVGYRLPVQAGRIVQLYTTYSKRTLHIHINQTICVRTERLLARRRPKYFVTPLEFDWNTPCIFRLCVIFFPFKM